MVENKELDILFPNGSEVQIKGEVFNIKPFTLGKIPKVVKLLEPVKDYFTNGDFLGAIGECGDNVIEVGAIAIGREKKFLDDVELDKAAELFKAIIEVNADLFQKKILPMIENFKKKAEEKTQAGS